MSDPQNGASLLSTADWQLSRETMQTKLGEKKVITDLQWQHFQHVAKSKGLDPLQNQITLSLHWDKISGFYNMAVITQIDGYRLIADRTGKYAGSDNPKYDYAEDLMSAEVTVYKMVEGQRCSFAAVAFMEEYKPDRGGNMWGKMPHLMLAKCAEALALRKAFPAELSGIYTVEEMQQADNDTPPPPATNGNDAAPPAEKPEVDLAWLQLLDTRERMKEKFPNAEAAIEFMGRTKTVQIEADAFIKECFEETKAGAK